MNDARTNIKPLKCIAISDTHCNHKKLKLPKADVIIHAGDISCRGRKDEVVEFIKWFEQLNYAHKILIAGNHDFFLEKEPVNEVRQIIPPTINYLQDSGCTIEGVHVWGSPFTPRFHDWAFNRSRGKEIRQHWMKIPAHTDLLVTHGPPYGILDQTSSEDHVGDRDLIEVVSTIKPKVHVFGHIHEGYGRFVKGTTTFINASLCNERYELIHAPQTFSLQASVLETASK